MSHRETDRHPSLHAYCMAGKYQCFQRHVANCFVNQMKNGNTLTQGIISKQNQVTTVDGPEKNTFRNIKHKHRENTAAQEQIQRFSPPVAEAAIKNEKTS